MDISKKLQQLYSLQERVSYADLGSQISDELFFEITNVLGKKKLADLGTLSRKNILGILSTKIRDLQILDQQQYQSWAIGKGMVTRAKD